LNAQCAAQPERAHEFHAARAAEKKPFRRVYFKTQSAARYDPGFVGETEQQQRGGQHP
jgi:hypothetical protein